MRSSQPHNPRDELGHLEEWGRVLNLLEQWTRDEQLDAHQADLVRLLRYPDNWHLREAALEAARNVKRPGEPLLADVLAILTDEHLYHELRVLAAEALAALLAASHATPDGRHRALEAQALEQMHALLERTHPPVLHQAIRRVLPTIS